MDQVVISKLSDWEELAVEVISVCAHTPPEVATVVVLTGDLGVGKTTLSQAIARQLGVSEMVQSPTFTIMKSYETTHGRFQRLVHMDAYRIDDSAELKPLRFSELLESPQTLVCIEWGERIEKELPLQTLHISINHQTDDIRLVTIGWK